MKTYARRRPLSAAEARAHAERHPQPVAGCEYCADREPTKLAKASPVAKYREAAEGATERCGACRFYDFGRCNLVEGTIAATDVCDLYQPPLKASLPEATTYSAADPTRRKESTVATVKNREHVFASLVEASKTFAGDTPEQRVSAYLRAHPETYQEYITAPEPERAPAPPVTSEKPLTASKARQLLAATGSREAANAVAEALTRELIAMRPALSYADALGQVYSGLPELFRAAR